jgi:transcriptional regulator with XRE-family HTH domain
MKKYRTVKKLTQKEAAEHLGYYDQQKISDIERGIKGLSNQARILIKILSSHDIDTDNL